MRSKLSVVAVMLAVVPAHAAPDDVITRPLVLDQNSVELRLTGEIGVPYSGSTQLVSLAPDAWWGISPKWTVGIIHSDPSVDRIDADASFCVANSATSPCDHVYREGGLDVRFSALAGQFAVAPRLRLLVRDVDPFKPATTLGALLRWTYGRFAVIGDPYLRLPLANHNLGNRAAISLPVWLAVQPATGWQIAVHTGFDSDLVVIRDGWHGPLGFGVTSRITREIDLGVEAGWAQLIGPQYDVKHAAVLMTAGWRD